MPTPAATICRSVSRLVARKSCFSCTPVRPTDVERLVAQAVAVLEQQQGLVGEVVELEWLRCGERVAARARATHERLLEQLARLQAVERHRQRQDSHIDFARAQFLQHQRRSDTRTACSFEARQLLAQLRHDVRQQIGADGREQRRAEPSRRADRAALRAELDDLVAGLARCGARAATISSPAAVSDTLAWARARSAARPVIPRAS